MCTVSQKPKYLTAVAALPVGPSSAAISAVASAEEGLVSQQVQVPLIQDIAKRNKTH